MSTPTIPEQHKKRIVDLEGGLNFRDIGGYQGADGRRVKWGQVYRSGRLSRLTDNDRAKIKNLGIKSVLDFRRHSERTADPSLWHEDHEPDVVSKPHPNDFEEGMPVILGQILSETDDPRRVMINIYWNMATDYVEHYKVMFERLASEDHRAFLFHCTGGKDRTGVAAALLLTLLGVSKEDIYEDYLLTSAIVPVGERVEKYLKSVKERFNVTDISREALRVMVSVNADYLDAAYKRFEQDYGSVEAYLRDRIGVDDAMKEKIRDLLLEQR